MLGHGVKLSLYQCPISQCRLSKLTTIDIIITELLADHFNIISAIITIERVEGISIGTTIHQVELDTNGTAS